MSRARSFEAFANSVSEAFARLSPQQQQIARFVLEHPDELALGTVATVADAAAVQPSALIRFANALGFGGFTEMQQVFRDRLLDRSSSYRERIDAMRRGQHPDAAGSGVLHQFVSDGMAELSQIEDNVRVGDLAAAADLICGATRVHVLAQRRAFPVAAYLAYALGKLDVKAQLLDGVGGMLPDVLRQIAGDELLLVTSFKDYTPEVVAAAAAAHARAVPVVAITDFAFSPLKPHARVCFELGQGSSAAFRSLMAPLCLAQALVVSVGHRLVAPQADAVRKAGGSAARKPAAKPAARAAAKAARKPAQGRTA